MHETFDIFHFEAGACAPLLLKQNAMEPKEKADELIDRFSTPIKIFDLELIDSLTAKGHALIAVDEIIDILELNGFTLQEYHDKGTLEYWLHVKQELEKL